jgi:cell division protein FtsQ
MSREGRRRLAWSVLRFLIALTVIVGVAVGGWQITRELRENPRNAPAVAAVPLSAPQLETDGFLAADATWLTRTLALPKNATLVGLDLDQLRDRLLAEGQVQTAVLTKVFPATLKVRITERTPVARVRAQLGTNPPQALLVARDGVVFAGAGYEDALVKTLPWLDPLRISRDEGGLARVAGMTVVAELLGKAKLEAEHLYAQWHLISLARLNTDAEVDVQTTAGGTIVFSASSDFFTQIAKLDVTLDKLAAQGAVFKRINLANGRDVTVTLESPVVPAVNGPGAKPLAVAAASAPRKASVSPSASAFGSISTKSKSVP